jgi:hypothetical protein
MFWEPGAFAGYLNIALLFMLIRNGSFIIGKYRREAMWIVIGIISTLSTMGYVVLACLVVFYIIQNYPLGRVLLLPVVLAISYYSYFKLPFLSEKIEEQYSVALEMSNEDISNQRFGAWKMDMQYITAEPVSGNGLHYTTRYRFHPWIDGDIGHGNGMSNFIVFWGIPFFLIWLWGAYYFAFRLTRSPRVALFFIVSLLLLLQGEQFLNFPLFLMFFITPAFEFPPDEVESSELVLQEPVPTVGV